MTGRHRSRILAALLPAIAALLVAGCGDLESEGSGDNSRGELTEGTSTSTVSKQAAKDLPPRPDGLVQIQGEIDGSIADQVIRKFPKFTARSGLAVRAEASGTDEDTGFAALCDGEIDITAASRRITDAEVAACGDNGLEVVDFQVAYDAIVVATRNERDVGADCVNIAQLRLMFGAGTPVTSWSQLNPNFFPLRLTTAGPTDQTSDFDFFGSRVLGVPDPTLADYRADYHAFARDVEVKNFVAGRVGVGDFRDAGRASQLANTQVEQAREDLRVADKELRDASRDLDAVGRRLDRAVAEQAVRRQARLEKLHDAAVARQKEAVKQQRKASRQLKRVSDSADEANQQLRRLDRFVPPGAVGIVGVSFYELFEEKLRPLEIDGQTGDRCVFPSAETIASELYPLERTLRLYTTTRSLKRPEVQAYIKFHLSQAEDIANRLELIPVPDSLRREEIAKITNPSAATDDSGSGTQTTTTDSTTTDTTSETTTESTSGELTTGSTTTTTTEGG